MPIEAFPDVTNTRNEKQHWSPMAGPELQAGEKLVTIPIEIAHNPVQKKSEPPLYHCFG